MLFNSFEFIVFFLIVLFLYFLIPHKIRWLFLLIASYYFYMSWNAKYALLMLFFTIVNYVCAIFIFQAKSQKLKKTYLITSLIMSFGLLFIFKYFNFTTNSISYFFSIYGVSFSPYLLNFILPVGISFYTFQTVGYVIDVYNNKIKPEYHLGIFALFVSFFPQLVAGPIERAKHLLPQFRKKHYFNFDNLVLGLKYIIWGFFLKLVLADRLAIVVNQVYNNVEFYTGLPLIIATYFFAFQIFCDFAGYSFIAIGSARIMGYDLMENFRRPYFAKSIGEFWKRWHISLSTWFKDYLYIPLGGNRVKVNRLYFNIMIVFIVSGIWHGANWTFIIWGFLHGFYSIFSLLTKNYRAKFVKLIKLDKLPTLHSIFSIFITFHLVLFGWIFFRANTLSDAIYVIKNFFVFEGFNLSSITNNTEIIYLGLLFIIILELIHLFQENNWFEKIFTKYPILEYGYYQALIFLILLFAVFSNSQFIYFQF